MDALYYLSGFLFIVVVVAGVIGLIKPQAFNKVLKKYATRKHILLVAVVLFFVLGGIVGATEPDSIKQERAERERIATEQKLQREQEEQAKLAQLEEEGNRITTQEFTESVELDFAEINQTDGTLPKGQTKTVQEGSKGEQIRVYTVTYKGGQETGRELKSETTTKEPVNKVIVVGTYEYTPPPSSSGGSGYTNSQGNYVPSPSSDPAGATARCRDGTYSYSQSRRGTCSHHGGVAQWL